nr:class I SAM-dependent methyltransferase [Bradyrhizobium nanningense]
MADKFTHMDTRLYCYLLAHQPPEHDELKMLRLRTQTMPDGRMQISPEQGHLLALLVAAMAARRILEVGTFTGYSTLAIAQALPPEGRIIACDINDEWTAIACEHWKRAGVADRIDVRIAPAVETLGLLEAEGRTSHFDLAFIDADKTSYDTYYEGALRLVRPGGLIILTTCFGAAAWPIQMKTIPTQSLYENSIRRLQPTSALIVSFCRLPAV